ncbi:hypothetical protein [Poseidonocella sedimentorum]|uniref:Uncharacterized protein n=1 Tax=Poseidonocella sedimentorum TaxID=871652 RepID=A0A1I6DLC6_9RHOB|nr:hypothetical protein [Poseidonocella sedimentorum]SFR06187.1 hypothetical protein SAMN04515673_10457 [Poseidonocella sedimentorum]
MHFLIQIPAKGFLMQLEPEHLAHFREALEASSITAAFCRVGGGLVIIADHETPGHLMAELRKHQILDAEVTPLVPLSSVLEGYMEHKATGRVGKELVS